MDRYNYITNTPENRQQIKDLLRGRVLAGIELLNSRQWDASWYFTVNLDDLDINDPNKCILGQLFGDYMVGLEALELLVGISHGFSSVYAEDIDAIWREEIIKLRRREG